MIERSVEMEGLTGPEHKVCDHLVAGYADMSRNMVREVLEGRPDSFGPVRSS